MSKSTQELIDWCKEKANTSSAISNIDFQSRIMFKRLAEALQDKGRAQLESQLSTVTQEAECYRKIFYEITTILDNAFPGTITWGEDSKGKEELALIRYLISEFQDARARWVMRDIPYPQLETESKNVLATEDPAV